MDPYAISKIEENVRVMRVPCRSRWRGGASGGGRSGCGGSCTGNCPRAPASCNAPRGGSPSKGRISGEYSLQEEEDKMVVMGILGNFI